jgi:hypothetical protein
MKQIIVKNSEIRKQRSTVRRRAIAPTSQARRQDGLKNSGLPVYWRIVRQAPRYLKSAQFFQAGWLQEYSSGAHNDSNPGKSPSDLGGNHLGQQLRGSADRHG